MDIVTKGEVSFVAETPKLSGDACYSSIPEPVPLTGPIPLNTWSHQILTQSCEIGSF